jgi:hypothetical protein
MISQLVQAKVDGETSEIEGVTMPEDMEFNVLFNNWQGVRLLPGALFEARGTVTIEDDRPVLTADLIRV